MRNWAAWLIVFLVAPALVTAKRLPIKSYTTADGLARDHIFCIVQDSRGFLWFCTAEGLSRFDGYRFTNYRVEQGLPGNEVSSFLETRKGAFWITTSGGLCRFFPRATGASRFVRYPLNSEQPPSRPVVLYEDRAGGVWCGTRTNAGVFHMGVGDSAFRHVDLRMTGPSAIALLVDRRGTLWVGTPDGLVRREPDGTVRMYTTADGLPPGSVAALLEDREGRLWVATANGLVRIDRVPEAGGRLAPHLYTSKDGLAASRVDSLIESADGKLWVGTAKGLAEWIPAGLPDGHSFQSYTAAEGLTGKKIGALAEDRDGNLWMGAYDSGAMKIARGGFTTYLDDHGGGDVVSLMQNRKREMCALNRTEAGVLIAPFDGLHFIPRAPGLPRRVTYYGWGRGQVAVQDQAGEWWIATGQGLFRYASVDRWDQLAGARPKACYTTRDGLRGDDIFRVFEDSRGDIWIGTIGPTSEDGLARWDRRTGRVHAFSSAEGLPEKPVPTAFAEHRSGDLWISLFHGGVARYRGGRFTVFTAEDGVRGNPKSVFTDSTGRLWIASSQGLIRSDDPTADRPAFVTYNAAQGFSSDDMFAITEDRWGRIYAVTGRGIDRFEPLPSSVAGLRHYTTADGVVGGELDLALRDRQGTLWFASADGISQLIPTSDGPRAPPPVLITALDAGGAPYAVSDLGQSAISGLRLRRNPLRIDFVAPGFSTGETLRYQYKLEGADRDWSAPTDQRSVVYASLSAGSYRFLVRAVASDGAISPRPAIAAFSILPPVWRSWWFLSMCGMAVTLIVYALHRVRLAQLLAVANVRTRIATDLHDDIGASLSQISILSEIAQRSHDGSGSSDRTPLSEIAGISRELVDSMGDIVWAINPDHDHLSNLGYRMRRLATDLLGGQRIALQFRSSVADQDLRIGANLRREVYLIFKEGIHNVVRHSGASRVAVEFDRVQDSLVLQVSDDGKGFDPDAGYEGHGLINMRKRAAALGASLELQSAPGRGATLKLIVRLEQARTLAALRGN